MEMNYMEWILATIAHSWPDLFDLFTWLCLFHLWWPQRGHILSRASCSWGYSSASSLPPAGYQDVLHLCGDVLNGTTCCLPGCTATVRRDLKGTLCKNYSHLVVQLYIAFKLIVLACPKTTVGSMCQEAVTWHLLPHRVIRVMMMRFVIFNKLQTALNH